MWTHWALLRSPSPPVFLTPVLLLTLFRSSDAVCWPCFFWVIFSLAVKRGHVKFTSSQSEQNVTKALASIIHRVRGPLSAELWQTLDILGLSPFHRWLNRDPQNLSGTMWAKNLFSNDYRKKLFITHTVIQPQFERDLKFKQFESPFSEGLIQNWKQNCYHLERKKIIIVYKFS